MFTEHGSGPFTTAVNVDFCTWLLGECCVHALLATNSGKHRNVIHNGWILKIKNLHGSLIEVKFVHTLLFFSIETQNVTSPIASMCDVNLNGQLFN